MDSARCAPAGARRVHISFCSEAVALEAALQAPGNPWADALGRWGVGDRLPVAVATRADPDFAALLERERAARLEAFAAGLEGRLLSAHTGGDTSDNPAGVPEARRAAALEAFSKEYEAATLELEEAAAAAAAAPPPIADDPPMTSDPQLHAESQELALPGGGALLLCRFPGMTGGHVGIALSLRGLPRRLWLALPGLSAAVRNSGIAARPGRSGLSYAALCDKLQREVLYADVSLTFSRQQRHVEVLARAAGLTAEESLGSVRWLEDRLTSPSLSAAELPRLRDAINKAHQSARKALEQRGEFWVDGLAQDSVALAEALQRGCEASQLQLVAGCSATRTHALLRLKWRLREPPAAGPSADAARQFLDGLAATPRALPVQTLLKGTLAGLASASTADGAGGGAAAAEAAAAFGEAVAAPPGGVQAVQRLITLTGSLPQDVRALAMEAIEDLSAALVCSSEVRFAADWEAIAMDLSADVMSAPAEVLADWAEILRFACRRPRARAWISAGPQSAAPLSAALRSVVAHFPAADSLPSPSASGAATAAAFGPAPAAPANAHAHNGSQATGGGSGHTGLVSLALRLLQSPFASASSSDSSELATFAATTPFAPGGRPPGLVGIVHQQLSAGAVVSMSACSHEADPSTWSTDRLLDALSVTQLAGAGAHSLFIRTWGAGLAYGNGVALSLASGRCEQFFVKDAMA